MGFSHFEYGDGRRTQKAYFDGYSVGERLLEGLMFSCEIQNDGSIVVEFVELDDPYVQGLNTAKWRAEALQYAKDNDVFSDSPDGDGEDVYPVMLGAPA